MDPANVRVVSPYIGGAFGSKGAMTSRSPLVALAARRLNRPVKLVVTRSQGFTTATYRAETRHRLRLGADRDGKLTALTHEGWEVTSRSDPYLVGGTEASTPHVCLSQCGEYGVACSRRSQHARLHAFAA